MDYQVKSFKEAISICLKQYGYDNSDVDIIRNLINYALTGQFNYFTRTNGARNYVLSKTNNDILNEMIRYTNNKDNINEIIDDYIISQFTNTKIEENTNEEKSILKEIEEQADLNKVQQKIRYLNIESLNDYDFKNNLWSTFQNIFSGNDKNISGDELRYDMIYAAKCSIENYWGQATVLKQVDPNSKNLTKFDALRIVEDYIYSNRLEELFNIIKVNPILSGQLLENLFDYSYFKGDVKPNKDSMIKLDKEIEKIGELKLRSKILCEILNGNKIGGFNIDKDEALIDVLKNSLALNVYSQNNKSIDYDERNLYTGSDLNKEESTIQNRIFNNNRIANNLIIKGKTTDLNDLADIIRNLSDEDKSFLGNMYVLSRSLPENKNKLDNSIYYGTDEQIYVYGMLEKKELKEKLKYEEVKKVA